LKKCSPICFSKQRGGQRPAASAADKAAVGLQQGNNFPSANHIGSPLIGAANSFLISANPPATFLQALPVCDFLQPKGQKE
jgi:hypothetical protein